MADPLATTVHARLVSDIVTLRFTPGQALSENELASEYGVSRTPVREAVQRLRQAGLVEVRPQSGTLVSKVDLARFREAQFVRETLETACIELALSGSTPVAARDIAAMRREISAQRQCAADRDPVGFVRHDEAMHRIICALSGHENVWDTIAQSKVHLDRVRHMSLVTQDVMRMLVRQHRAIVDGIATANRKVALAAARQHTRETLRVLPHLIASHPDYFSPMPAGDPAADSA
ncbi:MAG: GntR family transcriptional regulator, rspAB operon transcriptional repressor [Frankiaceae bacterium]|nr:GntR family transcriptional regulator, rspAB operon transcriptional repressor [Frankiaceae bacterium]